MGLFVFFVWFVFPRWDIQRIREQRILQRLQLRMYKKKGIQESEPEVTSFFPEPDDGKFCLSMRISFLREEKGYKAPGYNFALNECGILEEV